MLGAFAATDIYRVMLGTPRADDLNHALAEYQLPAEASLRHMRRDDGSGVWVTVVLLDGETLERIALLRTLSLMQVDNISARLRAAPSLPGGNRLHAVPQRHVAA